MLISGYCRGVFDTVACWNHTAPGETAMQSCPSGVDVFDTSSERLFTAVVVIQYAFTSIIFISSLIFRAIFRVLYYGINS